ncbi:MAG: hypothetical protein U0559_08940 [Anaerolineae bacterium]
MSSFAVIIVILIGWLIIGSIGATWLTTKGYLAPEARTHTRPTYTHRTTALGLPSQYLAALLGPVAFVAALILPAKR